MLRRTLIQLTLVGCALIQHPAALANTPLTSDADKISYTIGADLGKKFKEQKIDVNANLLLQGFNDAQQGKTLLLNDKEMNEVFVNLQKQMLEKHIKEFQQVAKEHMEAGKQYLEKNKAAPNVVTTASGLQYRIIKEGHGKSPTATDMVSVDYTGKTIDGKVFDTTQNGGKPAEFRVNQVIAGWQEALQLMQPGAEWEVVIPSSLAYGQRGAGQMIGPNETLIFTIQLHSVKQNAAAKKN